MRPAGIPQCERLPPGRSFSSIKCKNLQTENNQFLNKRHSGSNCRECLKQSNRLWRVDQQCLRTVLSISLLLHKDNQDNLFHSASWMCRVEDIFVLKITQKQPKRNAWLFLSRLRQLRYCCAGLLHWDPLCAFRCSVLWEFAQSSFILGVCVLTRMLVPNIKKKRTKAISNPSSCRI